MAVDYAMGVAVLIIGISAVLAFISFRLGANLENDKAGKKAAIFLQPLKLFLLIISLWLLVIGAGVGINIAEEATASADVLANLETVYVVMLWSISIIIFYFVIFYIWSVAQYMLSLKRGDDEEEGVNYVE